MEPEAALFLRRVGKSLTLGFLWLAINAIFAIKGDNAFIEGKLRLGNVLFYTWFIISIIVLVRIFRKMWSRETIDKQVETMRNNQHY
jgi:hypothetical protein